ncbi:phage baseplate assembly protein V [Caviibacterium pharyngocola]|uniref:Phage baseplate assembly protein V n=1 Tax=Caviibacterium pharyngocola TaxID=28159 RepID=A0A2M8RY01_9PAST|nr:phage baseplate assembly protein V [Caviibacterium pharyngocola]PJG83762.1 phage baseplate assembly protein V [Caviibacterium pharyngocola]
MRQFMQKMRQTAQDVTDTVRAAFRGELNWMKSGDDIQKTQVSALADETLSDVELMQHFGFTSVPPAGTQAVILPIGGATTHGIVIATENGSFRVKNLENGEVAVYDQSGSTIILKQGRLIEVDCDTFKLNCKTYRVTATSAADFVTPKLETSAILTAQGQINGNGGMAVQGGKGASFSGDVKQTSGSITTVGDVTASGKSLVNHTHKGDSGGTTSKPI